MSEVIETQEISMADLEAAIANIEATPRPPAVFVEPDSREGTIPLPTDKPVPVKVASPLDLKEYVNVEQLKRDVTIDLNDLDNSMRRHASLFVHYANLARLARAQFERMKATVDVLESKLYALKREQMTAEGKKPTEASLEAACKLDPRWMSAQQKVIDARAIWDLANDAREAFSHNKDMLIQVSVDRRKEREGDLRMTAEKATITARDEVLKIIKEARESAAGNGQ